MSLFTYTAAELYSWITGKEDIVVVDVRNTIDFGKFHLESPFPVEMHNIPYFDFIEDEDAVDPVRVTEELDIADSLRRSISRLPDREGRILALRYGFLDGVPRTLEEIGDEFNLTRERIRQLEKLALCRLRHPSFGIREQDLV